MLGLFDAYAFVKVILKNIVTVKHKVTSQQHPYLCYNISGNGGLLMRKNENCLYCSTKLPESTQAHKRKYCTVSCGNKYKLRMRKPECEAKLWVHEKNVFETAMELHWSGEESGAIARRLNIPVGTMYSWVHDFGGQRQRKVPLKQLLHAAKSADEWLIALRESTISQVNIFEDSTIHLVCGTFHGQSVKRFTSVIYESLNDNPLNGNIYAFCNKTRNTITTFAWKSPVFNIAKNVKMHGTFIWPQADLGKTIEVTKAEFDRLLFLNKQEILAEKLAKNLDIMQV
jgi:transposase-like protein